MSLPSGDLEELRRAYETARDALLAEQLSGGYWVGELSSSALATATAVSALSLLSHKHFRSLPVRVPTCPSGRPRRTLSPASTAHSRDRRSLIDSGLRWLQADQNPDGGWGDSPAGSTGSRQASPSNLPTTILVQAAFALASCDEVRVDQTCLRRAEQYVSKLAGPTGEDRVEALQDLYGEDRTFAVPILANWALASEPCSAKPATQGGEEAGPTASTASIDWSQVPGLPFELACLPRSWFRFLRLHVVSYALPALIAIGQLIHARRPTRNPFLRLLRRTSVGPALRRLEAIQPGSGGFLEAVPLTSFVTMSLAATGLAHHPVARRGADFLAASARADGSWPIDSNLSVWLTTQAVAALAAALRLRSGRPEQLTLSKAAGELPRLNCTATRNWLLDQQYTTVHPYTDSPPGGWAWTHLPGGVPDADDTAGALLALAQLGTEDREPAEGVEAAVRAGVTWLLDLQNADGGWPTFCRGWGKLPFDRSAPDLTAHAIRALVAWSGRLDLPRAERAVIRGFDYLRRTQRADGAWLPLWFGNQAAPEEAPPLSSCPSSSPEDKGLKPLASRAGTAYARDKRSLQENPVYGTARVLLAYADALRLRSGRPEQLTLSKAAGTASSPEARRGVGYLLRSQGCDGGWGGARGVASSVEETALAVQALAGRADEPEASAACLRGARYLAGRMGEGGLPEPVPVGVYFAKLWYAEKLYPIIWTVAALGAFLGGEVWAGAGRQPATSKDHN